MRHVNTLGVAGARTASNSDVALADAPLQKLPSPFIALSDLEGGAAGSADYRLQLVNTSAGQTASVYFSYDKLAWALYSPTGNYRDGITGSVLPTTNVGEISLSAGGQLFARQTKNGFLTSDVVEFFNNTSKTPWSDGTGGGLTGGGAPGKNLP